MNIVKINRPSKDIFNFEEFEKMFDWKGLSDVAFNLKEKKYGFSPKSEITEDKDNFYISAELPGVSKEDVKISLEDNTLTISGTKKQDKTIEEKTKITNERFYGEFKRTFNLTNDIKKDNIEAAYKDGVLHVLLPKVEEAKPFVKEITIK